MWTWDIMNCFHTGYDNSLRPSLNYLVAYSALYIHTCISICRLLFRFSHIHNSLFRPELAWCCDYIVLQYWNRDLYIVNSVSGSLEPEGSFRYIQGFWGDFNASLWPLISLWNGMLLDQYTIFFYFVLQSNLLKKIHVYVKCIFLLSCLFLSPCRHQIVWWWLV